MDLDREIAKGAEADLLCERVLAGPVDMVGGAVSRVLLGAYHVRGPATDRSHARDHRQRSGRAELLAAGTLREGLATLESAVQDFDSHGMVMDAGLARLALAEALLLLKDREKVPSICQLAIVNFTDAGTPPTRLREAAALSRSALAFVRKARAAMRKVAVERRELFVTANERG